MFKTSRFENMMSASAACAEASFSCASSSANKIALIILASIIVILGLVLRTVILGVSLILVVLAVLVRAQKQNTVKSVPTA